MQRFALLCTSLALCLVLAVPAFARTSDGLGEIGDMCNPALGSSDCVSGTRCSNNGVCVAVAVPDGGVSPGNPSGPGGGVSPGNPSGGPTTPGTGSGQLFNPLGTGASLPGLISAILAFVVRLGAVVVVVMLVYVGFLFVTAQGNETKITAARSALLWTLVGGLILLGAQAIALAIQATVTAISTGG